MIKTKVIATKLVPEGNIVAITLFGLVFTRHKRYVRGYVLNHERIHCQQQLEWLYLPFFVIYVVEWLCLWARYRDRHKAYRNISFEREAYAHERDLTYLEHRKCYQTFRRG